MHKNPDFKVKGQPKIIELWGDYWHRGEFPKDIIEGWRNAGIKCMVIWEHEIYEDLDRVIQRVSGFVRKDAPQYEQAEFQFVGEIEDIKVAD